MSSNHLELNGKLKDFPVVELLREAKFKNLSGTLRFVHELQKVAVYFSEGQIVFAASNLRHHRLAFKLQQKNVINEKETPEFFKMNEVELRVQLISTHKITAEELHKYQNEQATEILATISQWTDGTWELNPLVRAREDLRIEVNLPLLMTTAARNLPPDLVETRFKDEAETFEINPGPMDPFDLSPIEAFVFSRIDPSTNNFETISAVCTMPETQIKHLIYVLWLGGLIIRSNVSEAFNEQILKQAQNFKPVINRAPAIGSDAKTVGTKLHDAKTHAEEIISDKNRKPEKAVTKGSLKINFKPEDRKSAEEETVEDFLNRIESAKSHYQVLGVEISADASTIKQHYFKLAKSFHPDKYHQLMGTEIHTRLQNAFSKVAQAHETLKVAKSRELYDFKLRKQGGFDEQISEISDQAPEEIFEQGISSYEEGNLNEAIAFFNRAVQVAPENAKYHAYYGQALAETDAFRHQAEAELQNAIRLDEKNPEWRLFLVDFYLNVGLQKRAVGELNRLLILHPNHAQARQLLADIALK